MPKLPSFNSERELNPGAGAESQINAATQNIRQIGGIIETAADFTTGMKKLEDQRKQTQIEKDAMNLELQISQAQEDLRNDPNMDENQRFEALSKQYNQGRSALVNAYSGEMANFAEKRMLRSDQTVLSGLYSARSSERAKALRNDAAEISDNFAKQVVVSPGSINGIESRVSEAYANLNINPEVREGLVKETLDKAYKAHADSIADSDPHTLKALFDNGFYTENVSAGTLAQIKAQTEQASANEMISVQRAIFEADSVAEINDIQEQLIVNNPIFSKVQKDRLGIAAERYRKVARKHEEAIVKKQATRGDLITDPKSFNTDDKMHVEAINDIYDAYDEKFIEQATDENGQVDPVDLQKSRMGFVKTYNYIPNALKKDIEVNVISGQTDEQIQAIAQMQHIVNFNPALEDEFSERSLQQFETYNTYLAQYGGTEQDAMKRANELMKTRDPFVRAKETAKPKAFNEAAMFVLGHSSTISDESLSIVNVEGGQKTIERIGQDALSPQNIEFQPVIGEGTEFQDPEGVVESAMFAIDWVGAKMAYGYNKTVGDAAANVKAMFQQNRNAFEDTQLAVVPGIESDFQFEEDKIRTMRVNLEMFDGDSGAAARKTHSDMKKRWGVSNTFGREEFTLHPPERQLTRLMPELDEDTSRDLLTNDVAAFLQAPKTATGQDLPSPVIDTPDGMNKLSVNNINDLNGKLRMYPAPHALRNRSFDKNPVYYMYFMQKGADGVSRPRPVMVPDGEKLRPLEYIMKDAKNRLDNTRNPSYRASTKKEANNQKQESDRLQSLVIGNSGAI